MTIQQISVFVENKPGKLRELTGLLARNRINLRALTVAETSEFGIVRVIVDDLEKAADALRKEGIIHTLTKVVGVSIPDEPGGLNRILDILGNGGMNVEYMYAFLGGKGKDGACMIFHVQDPEAAIEKLQEKGIACITREEVEKM